MQLVPYWRSFWRLVSVQLTVVGTILTGWLIASPDAVLNAWLMLPADLKAVVPPKAIPLVSMSLFVLSVLARIVRQPKTKEIISQKLVDSGKPPLPNTQAAIEQESKNG